MSAKINPFGFENRVEYGGFLTSREKRDAPKRDGQEQTYYYNCEVSTLDGPARFNLSAEQFDALPEEDGGRVLVVGRLNLVSRAATAKSGSSYVAQTITVDVEKIMEVSPASSAGSDETSSRSRLNISKAS